MKIKITEHPRMAETLPVRVQLDPWAKDTARILRRLNDGR